MTVFNAEEVKKCLEDVVGEDKQYALWLLEWAIDKRTFDLAEHDSELLDKVAEKIKAKYPLYFNEFGMNVNDTLHKNIDEVIAEMKAEIEE